MTNLGRALLHVPVGIVAAWLLLWSPPVGYVFAGSFLAYEVVEDWRVADFAYRDLVGFLVGLLAGAVTWPLARALTAGLS